jgi:hypothetical protein
VQAAVGEAVSAGWVAGSVRARALVRRGLGPRRARLLAGSGSLREALTVLAGTSYGRDVRPGQTLAAAQHAAAATFLWHLRVLAGWLPRDGLELVRAAAAWYEIANVDELLEELSGRPREPAFALGALATAWPRLSSAGTVADLRARLAASPWGDPGAAEPAAVRVAMRLRWASRIAGVTAGTAPWALGATALLVAGERIGAGRGLPEPAARRAASLIGARALEARTLAEMRESLLGGARWALDGIDDPAELWRGEARWWGRVERDAAALLRTSTAGPDPVLGAIALLATDLWRVRAALETAAGGGGPAGGYDAVA